MGTAVMGTAVIGAAVMAVASRFADRSWQTDTARTTGGIGPGLLRTASRLTNPDGLSRWVLRRLEKLPDVAEII